MKYAGQSAIKKQRGLSWMRADIRSHPLKHVENGVAMPLYEHVVISRQDLSNAQAEGLVEHFGKVLSENGGKVIDSEYWGLKTMAYKINKNRKGHYCFLKTDSSSAAVQEMERLMRIHEDIMRVLTIKVKTHVDGPSIQISKREDHGDRRERSE